MSVAVTTADGKPLKVSLARAQRRLKIRALLLVAPLLIFVFVSFLFPIAGMLWRSVDNDIVAELLPKSSPLILRWEDSADALPPEEIFAAMAADIQAGAKTKTINRLGQRLNYESSGMSSLFRKSARNLRKGELPPLGGAQDALIKMDKKWGEAETWRLIKIFSGKYTAGYYAAAVDSEINSDGEVSSLPPEESIYLKLFWRTLLLSGTITLLTLLLGFPIAFLLASLPTRISNLLLILVLLPFWTSLLVRTTSWIVLLQQQGVINDFLVFIGLIGDDGRLAMIHNATGTVIAMTHILLPFMVLPLYSVMKTISPSYVRAARSLGANSMTAFWRVYFPGTIPGIGAGAILVFILAIGYYITPELVGGTSGTFISNRIAYHVSSSLNWGLAASLGVILLLVVLLMYYLYDKIVGIDNMKLG